MSHLRLIVGGKGEKPESVAEGVFRRHARTLPALSRTDTEELFATYEMLSIREPRNAGKLKRNAIGAVFCAALACAEAGFSASEFARLACREWARAYARKSRLRPFGLTEKE